MRWGSRPFSGSEARPSCTAFAFLLRWRPAAWSMSRCISPASEPRSGGSQMVAQWRLTWNQWAWFPFVRANFGGSFAMKGPLDPPICPKLCKDPSAMFRAHPCGKPGAPGGAGAERASIGLVARIGTRAGKRTDLGPDGEQKGNTRWKKKKGLGTWGPHLGKKYEGPPGFFFWFPLPTQRGPTIF